MTTWKPISASDMLRAWGVAELRSPKAQKALDQGLVSAQVADALRSGNLDTLSEDGWASIEAAVLKARAPLIGNLLELGVEWFDGEMSVEDLQALRIIELKEWVTKYPTRMLTELCGARDPARTEPEFKGFGTEIERPVAVGVDHHGPLCLVEGYTRVCTFLRDTSAGFHGDVESVTPQPIPMILGLSPRIAEWTHPKGHRWFGGQ
jgi:hypothetical protein